MREGERAGESVRVCNYAQLLERTLEKPAKAKCLLKLARERQQEQTQGVEK